MARNTVQEPESSADYSKTRDSTAQKPGQKSPAKKITRPNFLGLSEAVQAERQQSFDFGPTEAFQLIHGGHGRHVAICQKSAGAWFEKMVSHENAQFAAVAMGGTPDAYISQNGFTSRNRRIQSVRALTSCAVDLDFYKIPNLAKSTPEEILGEIMTAYPWLPPVSALYESGRGAYAHWVFEHPLQADQLDRWQAVMDTLVEILEPWGADWNAKDASRVFRILGTVNSKSGLSVTAVETGPRVSFERFRCAVLDGAAEAHRRTESFTPDDDSEEAETSPTGQKKPASAAQRAQTIKPYDLAWARIQDYRTLAELRGKPKLTDGRHRMLFCFAVSMGWFASTKQAVIAECADFAQQHFHNPQKYTAGRIGSVLERIEQKHLPRIWNGRRVANRYRLRNSTIIKMLEISPDEMQSMRTLIDGKEKQRRRVERRRAAGIMERDDYLLQQSEHSENVRSVVLRLRQEGRKQREIAELVGLTIRRVQQLLSSAQPDMFE